MVKLTGPGRVINPSSKEDPDRRLLNEKFKVFLEQCESQRRFRDMVDKIEEENIKNASKSTTATA